MTPVKLTSPIPSELDDAHSHIERGLTCGVFRRAIDASDDAQLIAGLLRQIKFSIDKLTVHLTQDGILPCLCVSSRLSLPSGRRL